MMRFLRRAFAFLVAAAIAGLLGTALSTQIIMGELAAMGVRVPLTDRIDTTLHDIGSMGPVYTAVIALGLLVAFGVAALLLRFIKIPRFLGFGLAGFAAVIVAMKAMGLAYDIIPIPATREMSGLMILSAAGALGGMFYSMLSPKSA